ncbi:phage DNA packaging protein J [Thermodesulfobacteriota bacterium]
MKRSGARPGRPRKDS